ncbi:hypothetical protein H0H92_014652 [Tricholoma furcatifolium]|nr:hypothetical protein H0H92_014652 [Tricholoma furcatifolium]
MAASSDSASASISQPQPKIASSSSDTAPSAVEPVSDDAPLSQAPTANGVTKQENGALHDNRTETSAKGSAEPAAQNFQQIPTTSSSLGGVPVPSPGSEPQQPRGPITHSDKDRHSPGPSSPSPTNPSSHRPSQNANGNGVHRHSTPPQPKPSFFARLIRVLVPCVSSSDDTHPIEPIDTASLAGSKEKQPSPSFEHPVPPPTAQVVQDPAPLAPPVVADSPNLTTPEPVSVIPIEPSPDAEVPIQPTPPSPPHILPLDETEGVTSGAVQAPGSTGGSPKLENKRHSEDSAPPSNASNSNEEDSEGTSFTEDEDIDGLDEMEDDEDRLIMNGGAGIPIGPDGKPNPLLPPIAPQHAGRKCLILDLDETLVHSSFKSIQQADYVVPVEIEYHLHNVYVIKRPGVDLFLKKMGEIYEVVVFTASLSKVGQVIGNNLLSSLTAILQYADPVLDKLDIHQVVTHRLFRESCYSHRGNYVKDLSQLGRPIADTIILDNSPASYIFHPNNAVPVSSWFNDPHDTELTDLIPFLTDLATTDDVRGVLDGAR